GIPTRRDVLHHHRRAPARLRRRQAFLPVPAAPGRGRGDPRFGVLRQRRVGPVPGAVRVLQEAGGAGRGARPAGGGPPGGAVTGRWPAVRPMTQTGGMRPAGLHHVSINVNDVPAAPDFYTAVLGLTERTRRPHLRFGGALAAARNPAAAPALRPGRGRPRRRRRRPARPRRAGDCPGARRHGPPGVPRGPGREPDRAAGAGRLNRPAHSASLSAVFGHDWTAYRTWAA